ncbi:MAG: hypothetical protein WAL50_20190, partial [Kineosporiaceae bacterium]
MRDREITSSVQTGSPPWRRSAPRWMVTFLGFPLGGACAGVLAGPVDSPPAALLGGLITGSILGVVQAWALGHSRARAGRWIAATAIGLMTGLTLGSAAVGYATSLRALVVQGVVCGIAVGAAQAWVLWPRLGPSALAWPAALGAA